MYNGLISTAVIITVFFIAKAVIGMWWETEAFSLKGCTCFVLGSILGGLISTPLWEINRTLAYAGLGLGIGLMYILFYSGVIKAIINLIPACIQKGFKIAFNIIRVVLVVVAIIGAVWGVLTYIGV